MANHSPQKQTHSLRTFRPLGGSNARFILRKPHQIRRSSLLAAGIAATAGISSLGLALQQTPRLLNQSTTAADVKSSAASNTTASSTSEATITIGSSPTTLSEDEPPTTPNDPDPAITGQATINNEVIPLTDGTVQRTYTDDDGTQHSVTITVDGQSAPLDSSSSTTDIRIYSSSSSTTDSNTTRGSPRR